MNLDFGNRAVDELVDPNEEQYKLPFSRRGSVPVGPPSVAYRLNQAINGAAH